MASSTVRTIRLCTEPTYDLPMQREVGRTIRTIRPAAESGQRLCHVWQWSHVRHDSAVSSTYRVDMALSPEVASKRFSASVKDVLDRARARDLSDIKIRELTGVGPSTFHRWRRGEWGKEGPQLHRVVAFYEGLGEDPSVALVALGVAMAQNDPITSGSTDDPLADPDVRAILRRLADPKTSAHMRTTIKAMLRYLANLTDAQLEGDQRAA